VVISVFAEGFARGSQRGRTKAAELDPLAQRDRLGLAEDWVMQKKTDPSLRSG
jgi:hypothetical protein